MAASPAKRITQSECNTDHFVFSGNTIGAIGKHAKALVIVTEEERIIHREYHFNNNTDISTSKSPSSQPKIEEVTETAKSLTDHKSKGNEEMLTKTLEGGIKKPSRDESRSKISIRLLKGSVSKLRGGSPSSLSPPSSSRSEPQVFIKRGSTMIKLPPKAKVSGLSHVASGVSLGRSSDSVKIDMKYIVPNVEDAELVLENVRVNGVVKSEMVEIKLPKENSAKYISVRLDLTPNGLFVGGNCIILCGKSDEVSVDHIYTTKGGSSSIEFF